jgi:ABC-type transporter MlaC component
VAERQAIPPLVAAMLVTTAVGAAELPRPEPQIEQTFARIVDDVATVVGSTLTPEQLDCAMFDLVDEHLRPQFDFHASSRRILDRHWPESPEQQARFVEAFYDHLVARYGDLLIHFNEDTLRVVHLDENPEITNLWLETEWTLSNGDKVPAGLRMRYDNAEWRIVDVRPETFSYLEKFHDDFQIDVYDMGLEGLIGWLEEEAAPRRDCGAPG